MKGICIALLANALLFSMSFAKPSLVMNERVTKFMKAQNENFKKKFDSSVVLIDESSDNTYTAVKQSLSRSFDAYEPEKNVLRIKKENLKIDLSKLENDRNFCARKMLEKIMPSGYENMFILVTIDLERSFSKSQGAQIEGYSFNFKRLFNNRVVRNKYNYLVVRTDKNGFLKSADIRLQDLAITTERMKIDADYDENIASLDSLLNIESDLVDALDRNGNIIKVKIDKVVVGSVANAYCEVEMDAGKKLIPCVSYASKKILSNNESISCIIDVPYSRKSWSDYLHETPSARFIRYSR